MSFTLPVKIHMQKGAVLLIYLLIVLVGSSYFFIDKINKTLIYQPDLTKNYKVLQQAKQALIAYAVLNAESGPASRLGKYGFLPCPDTNGSNEEGNQIGNCSSLYVNTIGRFPWQTLDIAPLKDDSGECLWYAVSGAFKNSPNNMLNEDTTGSFRVLDRDGTVITGADAASRAVAVIIAPGQLIQNQSRTTDAAATNCGGNYTPANYLDNDDVLTIDNSNVSSTIDTIDDFVTTDDLGDDEFNDMVVYITADEIFDAINKRGDMPSKLYDSATASNLTKRVAECLAEYAINFEDILDNNVFRMPWPAPLVLDEYRDSSEYNDYDYDGSTPRNLYGRVPIIIDTSNAQLGIASADDNLIDDCDLGMTTDEKKEFKNLWENWKDHLFYSVAQPFQPVFSVDDVCGEGTRCITLNYDYAAGTTRDYAAVVRFSNSVLATQSRTTTPTDEKADITNYLENLVNTNNTDTYIDNGADATKRYDYDGSMTVNFNDIYYCINDNDGANDFVVIECPTNANTSGL